MINGQHNYEFLERDWALPLWDRAFVEFWRNVPVEQKYRQKLFRNALDRWNYRGLFRDFNPQVDQWSALRKPCWYPPRLIRLTLGPAKRDAFLRHMLYFGMYRISMRLSAIANFQTGARSAQPGLFALARLVGRTRRGCGGAVMQILYVSRLFSGLADGLREKRWEPRGVPTVYRLLEGLNRSEHDLRIAFTVKDDAVAWPGRSTETFPVEGFPDATSR